ncbi:Apolipophorin, partial [Araneus ventricosus]
PLLDGRYAQGILGVSALVRNFCNGKDCSGVPEVQTAVNKLSENLGENCFSSEDKNVILSLKAIGNIGYLFGKEDLLQACYRNPQIRTEARLAAIEAFRRVSCDVNREELMEAYSNYNEDTEIRIAAYLAVMKCPTISRIQEIKDVLLNEKINHVGSFIWTHLTALSKTKHPERREIRDIVSNLYLMNKFASDARKFSTA